MKSSFYYIVVALLLNVTNEVLSQESESLIINPSIPIFYSDIRISGVLNPKLESDNNFDRTKLKIYGNGQPCKRISLEESSDSITIHLFIKESVFDKKDSLSRLVKELDLKCTSNTRMFLYLIDNGDSIGSMGGAKDDTADLLPSNCNYSNKSLFDYSTISSFVDSLGNLKKTKELIILYSNGRDDNLLDILLQLANTERNGVVYFGYISYSKDKLKPLVFFEKAYKNVKTSVKGWFGKDSKVITQKANSKFLVYDKIENVSSNYFCNKLDSITNHYIRIGFESCKRISDSDTIHYLINYETEGVVFSNSFIDDNYGNTVGEDNNPENETLSSAKGLVERLGVLYVKYEKKSNDNIRKKAKGLVEKYWETEEIKNNPDKLFEVLEDDWDFVPTEDEWYKVIKISLLENKLSSTTKPEGRIMILDDLIKLSPNNEKNILEKYEIKGDLYSKNKEYEKAVESYSSYLELEKENEDISNKSKQCFKLAFEKYFSKKDFARIYHLGKGYSNYYRTSFKLRYYYYQACYEEKDYKMSLEVLNRLVDDWDNHQSLLKWDDAFVMLERLNSYNYHFDKAMKLDKRLYRDTISEEALNLYLINLRLKHLILISDAFPIFMRNVKSVNLIKSLSDNIPKTYPSFINGIYMKNRISGSINKIVEYNSISVLPAKSLDDIKMYPAFIYSKSSDIIWIVNEQGDNLIVIEFSLNPIDIAESNFLSGTRNNRLMVEPWEDLANYEAQFLQKYCTGILAGMISSELDMGLNGNIYNYWEAIHVNSKLVYLLKYDKEGDIEQNKSFLANNLGESSLMWVKSETTKTFFKQEITYNSNKIDDITNPLYKKKIWNGTVKIGFQK